MGDKHKVIDFTVGGGVLFTVACYCVENLAPAYWPKGWNLNWFAILAAIVAFWFGGQVTSWINNRHWLQDWLRLRGLFITAPAIRKQKDNNSLAYIADLDFTRHVRNVTGTVEVYRAEIKGFSGDWSWRRLSEASLLKRADCNKGYRESFKLLELMAAPPAQPPSPPPAPTPPQGLNSLIQMLNAPPAPQPKAVQKGRYKARLIVTAAGYEPSVHEWTFLWVEDDIYPMPLEVPNHEGQDSSAFKGGDCQLWLKN